MKQYAPHFWSGFLIVYGLVIIYFYCNLFDILASLA